MPVVRIDIQSGKSDAYKRAILHGVRGAIRLALELTDDRIMQRIIETPAENIDVAGVRSDHLTVVTITMVEGRDLKIKTRLYREVTRRLGAEPGIDESDLVVLIEESAGDCFYVRGIVHCEAPDTVETGSGS